MKIQFPQVPTQVWCLARAKTFICGAFMHWNYLIVQPDNPKNRKQESYCDHGIKCRLQIEVMVIPEVGNVEPIFHPVVWQLFCLVRVVISESKPIQKEIPMNQVESERRPLLSARQVGVAAAFGGAALAVVLAGLTIPIPGTPVVTDPREIFTTIGASLTGPIGGIVIGILAGIAEPGIPLASLLAHIVGGIYSGLVYKNLSWRFNQNKVQSLVLWALQVIGYYVLIVVPLFVTGIMLFYPDPANGTFFSFLGVLEASVIPELTFATVVTTIIMAALPERFRRPLW